MSDSKHLAPQTITATATRHGRLGYAFSSRFFLLLVIGMAWLSLAFFDRRFAWAMVAWDVMLLVLWIIDLAKLPRPRDLRISRAWSGPPSLDASTVVDLNVELNSAAWLDASLIDEAPPEAVSEIVPIPLNIQAGSGTASYHVQPCRRGDLKFGATYIRYRSRLRIAERWARADLSQIVRVYPNLQDFVDYSMYLMRNRQIELEKRLLRLRGQGREFESLREYRAGDDYRAVSWTATARRAKLVVRQFQIERSQPIWLVLDCGRLMRAEIGRLNKLDFACNAALSLAHVALHGGDKVGLLIYGRRPRARLMPGRGPAHLRQLLELLALAKPEPSEGDHMRAAATLLSAQQRRSLVIWITDLADTAVVPEVISGATTVALRHLMIFAAIAQPELWARAEEVPTDKTSLYQVTAAREVAQRRELLLAKLKQQGAFTIEMEPDKLSQSIISQYLDIKEKNLL